MPGVTTRATRDDQLEARVVVAAKAVRRAFDTGMTDLGLNMSEGGVLANLAAHGGLSQTELAARLHIGRASSGVLVEELERRGLVTRRADPNDRRVWHVELTDAGAELARRFEIRHAQVRTALRRSMSPSEAKELGRLLGALADNASRYVEDLPAG